MSIFYNPYIANENLQTDQFLEDSSGVEIINSNGSFILTVPGIFQESEFDPILYQPYSVGKIMGSGSFDLIDYDPFNPGGAVIDCPLCYNCIDNLIDSDGYFFADSNGFYLNID